MKTLCQKIRDKRVLLNVSQEEVSHKTKIPVKIIAAIEDGTVENILEWVYIKSYIKKLADFLKIPSEVIFDEFKKTSHLLKQEIVIKQDSLKIKIESGKKRIKFKPIFLGIISVIILGFILWGSVVFIPRINFKRQAKTKIKQEVQVPKAVIPQVQFFKVRLRAKKDVWMQVTVDGRVLFSAILSEGRSIGWDVKEKVLLWVGNVDAVSLQIDGKDYDIPGRGVVKDIVITREGAKR
ncbi:hypothetical protein B9J78_03920 [bacterium Unc6]|nr:hypothetical protein [bacterium Unc6]